MNKAALYTAGRKLSGGTVFLVSVFDLEPSGVIVHAYNQINSAEYLLPVSEADLSRAAITRASASLAVLIESIVLVPSLNGEFELQSTLESISDNKKRPTGEEVETLLKSPIKRDAEESIHSLITSGLVELCKVKPVGVDAVEFLGEWLLKNNPNRPVVNETYEVDESS
jgi:hypothetical protein